MNPLDHDDPQFLGPAHSHDPSQVAHITTAPQTMTRLLPRGAQMSLRAIQTSTSVVFASYKRLEALVTERFHRLVPAKDQDHAVNMVQYSEPAFFNYTNHIRAEREYLLDEALVDWKHKAARIDFAGHHQLSFTLHDGAETTLLKWWQTLQDEVDRWTDRAEETEIPDFAETVAEYRLFQAKELRKDEVRNERNNRRRKTMLDLERPDLGGLALEKMDSGISI